MILKLDETVGLILDELEQLGIDDRTMIVFCSDNGHEVYTLQQGRTSGRTENLEGEAFDNIRTKFYSEAGGDVFNGNDGMAGLKWSSWEGGTRIPYLVRWPTKIDPGSLSDHILANYDLMPTLAELIGAELPHEKDGLSFLPTLLGRSDVQQTHPFIIYASWQGPALVTQDNWKLRYVNSQDSFQLYDLNQDYREENDLAKDNPSNRRAVKSVDARCLRWGLPAWNSAGTSCRLPKITRCGKLRVTVPCQLVETSNSRRRIWSRCID